MGKIKIMVVDDNIGMVDVIDKYFSENNSIDVCYKAYDGEAAIELIKTNHKEIDLILLDIVMPKKDGIAVLEYMMENKINKKVIALTSCESDDIINMVANLGVSYLVAKPYDLKDLEKRIISLSNVSNIDTSKFTDFCNSNLQTTISKMLHELGIPSHIKGYLYIREGITRLYYDPDLIGAITKKLYPELAQKYDTTTSRVERAMRHAIEVGWTRSDWKMTDDLFGQSVDYDRAKPTNSEFLVTLADKLRLDNKVSI